MIARFLERRGHRVIESPSCWWYNEYRQKRVLTAFPHHRLIDLPEAEAAALLHASPEVFALQFLVPLSGRGRESFLWSCHSPYDLSTLSAKSRNQTRRGIERCRVRQIGWNELIDLAWDLDIDTSERHGYRIDATHSLGFDVGLGDCPAYEAWAAFAEDRLAAYLVTLWVEDWVHILVHRSATANLRNYPNNALVYSVVREMLSRPGVGAVSYGREPLGKLENLEHFKLGMGFGREPVRQRVLLAPWIRVAANPYFCKLLELIAARRDSYQLWRLAGVLRIALES